MRPIGSPAPSVLEMEGIGGRPREEVPPTSGGIRLPELSALRPHQRTAIGRPERMLAFSDLAQSASIPIHYPDPELAQIIALERQPRPTWVPRQPAGAIRCPPKIVCS